MMGLGNKQNAIDKLLRASGARPGDPPQVCREFDADLANAYVERSLTAGEIAHYEQHLSACTPCRKSVVALTRLSAADPASSRTNAKPVAFDEPRTGQLTTRRGWFGALLTPRWAMAAAAVIVLAISLPFLLASRKSRMEQSPSATQSVTAPSTDQALDSFAPAVDKPREALAANVTSQPSQPPAASNSPATVEKESAHTNGPATATTQPSVTDAPPADALATAAAPKPAVETKPASSDEAIAKKTERAEGGVPGGASAPRQNEPPLPKIDPGPAKSLPADKDTPAPVTTLTRGRDDGKEREKADTTIRSESNIAPPPKPQTPEPHASRKGMSAKTAGAALRDRSEEARSRPRLPGKKVAKKQFWLRDNVWTDEDYSPDKDMPVVTLIRDSEVYKEVLVARAGMKSYLTGFGETESVIFVYKGTIYKLVPQKDNK